MAYQVLDKTEEEEKPAGTAQATAPVQPGQVPTFGGGGGGGGGGGATPAAPKAQKAGFVGFDRYFAANKNLAGNMANQVGDQVGTAINTAQNTGTGELNTGLANVDAGVTKPNIDYTSMTPTAPGTATVTKGEFKDPGDFKWSTAALEQLKGAGRLAGNLRDQGGLQNFYQNTLPGGSRLDAALTGMAGAASGRFGDLGRQFQGLSDYFSTGAEKTYNAARDRARTEVEDRNATAEEDAAAWRDWMKDQFANRGTLLTRGEVDPDLGDVDEPMWKKPPANDRTLPRYGGRSYD